jgi:hypothetical protein
MIALVESRTTRICVHPVKVLDLPVDHAPAVVLEHIPSQLASVTVVIFVISDDRCLLVSAVHFCFPLCDLLGFPNNLFSFFFCC